MAADEHIRRLSAATPAGVKIVCQTLGAAGFQAYAVGGCVRDTLLGREVGDWDVATSAHPEEVQPLFAKVLPTGIAHGTVTVIVGKGRARESIEVTSFRGEGAYSDARRPDEVRFGVPLLEDLKRRDFVINAMAFDPIAGELVDPMDGMSDLSGRRLRAVGDASARFTEDGLRIMRAVRFAATLEFAIEANTEAAIPAALPSLEKVSRERVQVELVKLLAARTPSLGLEVALRTGVLSCVLPAFRDRDRAVWEKAIERIDRSPAEPALRFAQLLVADSPEDRDEQRDEVAAEAADAILRDLKWSNTDRALGVAIVRWGRPGPWLGLSDPGLRTRLSRVGRQHALSVAAVLRSHEHPDAGSTADRIDDSLAQGHPLEVRDLAVAGKDLMAELGAAPGPHIGETLRTLLGEVLDDPARNTRVPTRRASVQHW